MKERNSNFELLKVVGMFLIILSSSLPYGATYKGGFEAFVDLAKPTRPGIYTGYLFLRWMGQLGDVLFIASSAWFLSESTNIKVNKITKMICDSWIISVLGLIISMFFLKLTSNEVLLSFFPTTAKRNWFVGAYIFYYALHPYVNKALANVDRNHLRRILFIFTFLYSFVCNILKNAFFFTELVAFIMIHIIVIYDKKYIFSKNEMEKEKRYGAISIGILLLWCVFVSVFFPKVDFLNNKGLLFCKYTNPLLIVLGICCLNVFARKKFTSSIINIIASVSLYVYLLHGNYFWLTYGKYRLYDFLLNKNLSQLVSTIVIVLIYICFFIPLALIYAKYIGHFVEIIVCPRLLRMLKNIDNKLSNFV